MQATINIFCLFIRVHDVTYAEIQFNRSLQLHKFMKNGQNTIKLYYRRLFLLKSNKKCKENQGWHVLYIRGYDVTYAECKTL